MSEGSRLPHERLRKEDIGHRMAVKKLFQLLLAGAFIQAG